ncbi:MAG: hypothetical protein RBU29_12965, partial [bacterium]|nr:hypothetical protein [bacterium]
MMVNRAYNNQRNRRNRRGHGRWGLWFWLTFSWLLAPVLAQSEAWQPFAMPWDAAPVNLSFLLDPPAGKHGFLDIQDGKFEFEDGTPARFWGTTISGAACFPSHDQAPLIAERLSQLGINLVRLQSMDAPWAEISLFTLHANQQL